MNIITPIIELPVDELPATVEEAHRIVDQARTMMHEFTVGDHPYIRLQKALVEGREVTEYQVVIVAIYEYESDLWFVTAHGGHLNVDEMFRELRKALVEALS